MKNNYSIQSIQYVVKLLLQLKYQNKDSFFDEMEQIQQNFNPNNNQNMLVLQLTQKNSKTNYLLEDWTIQIKEGQMSPTKISSYEEVMRNNIYLQFNKIVTLQLAKLAMVLQRNINLEHRLFVNDFKFRRSDWDNPNLLETKEFFEDYKDISIIVNVAYMKPNSNFKEADNNNNKQSFGFKRDRYLSDDLSEEKIRNRKTSDNEGQSKQKISSNRPSHKKLVSLVPKQSNEFEIISSEADAQKIMQDHQDQEFEIQMIIESDSPLTKQINLKDLIQNHKKNVRKSDQIEQVLHFFQI